MIIINKSKLKCPTCGSDMTPAINLEGGLSTSWMVCTKFNCSTFVDTYVPQEHQRLVHKDPHRDVGVFGGYGSGKTSCTLKDDEKHMLSTPAGTTIVGSAVLSQVEQTYEKEFREDFPAEFVLRENKQKKRYVLINGHTLLIKSFYDEELLRSLNVSRTHIVEASAIDHEIFVQLQARLRNFAGVLVATDENGNKIYNKKEDSFEFLADWRRCFIESNPSVGWIRDSFLLESSYIYTGDEHQHYYVSDPDTNFASYIFPTHLNKFLPKDFISALSKNKPDWWIRRYLLGSFDYAEGMVYPNVMSRFIDPIPIPDSWDRIVAADYGVRDPTAFMWGAIDDKSGHVYIFCDEPYISDNNYEHVANMYWKAFETNIPTGKMYCPPVMDGRSINKRNDFNLKTIGDLYAEQGIYFNPAKMDLDARIMQLNTMIDKGTIYIFKTCTHLYKEITNYKFPERTADGSSRGDKPIDKNNHAINALEFLVMELPADMKGLRSAAYDGTGKPINYNSVHKHIAAERKENPYCPLFEKTKPKVDNGRFGDIYDFNSNDNFPNF